MPILIMRSETNEIEGLWTEENLAKLLPVETENGQSEHDVLKNKC